MTILQFLQKLRDEWKCIPRIEGNRCGQASNSELRRMIQQGMVKFNGEAVTWDEQLNFPISSVVFFGNGQNVTRLY